MSETGRGIAAVLAACLIWGANPLFYRLLADLPAAEVLAHRTFWSFVTFGTVLLLQRRWHELWALLAGRRGFVLVLAATLFISVNWFIFIWAVLAGRAVDAALGYYIWPLAAVLTGRIVFGEVLDRASQLAVALCALAVLVLAWGLSGAPWISLSLAATFAVYGAIKKVLGAGAVVSVTAEVLLILPVSGAFILGAELWGWGGAVGGFTRDWQTALLLILSGPLTAGPMVLFSYAARRVAYGTIGVLGYLNPTLQFLSAVLIMGEPFTRWHGMALPLIWLALAVYSAAALGRERAARNAARVAGTSGRAVM